METESFLPFAGSEELADRITYLIQPWQDRLGSWKVYPTRNGAVLAVSWCGLGDALFFPQALKYGGLDLKRIRLPPTRTWDNPAGSVVIGEIRWPRRRQPDDEGRAESHPLIEPPPESPLLPEQAVAQQNLVESYFFAEAPGRLPFDEARLRHQAEGLKTKWWPGIATHQETGTRRFTFTLQLATLTDEPLTPYAFETHVLSVLRWCAGQTGEDGRLLKLENPSPNFLVFCAATDGFVMKGDTCPAGKPHPA